ncbi:hypothetical protein ACH5RR_036720 [Cinchona calisaya]|uniref:Uncharacterized protein n=1 Tax=Cinchona calisaya TaxID=153742 RepID=A0ABD2Y6C5_9GENT
MAAKNTLATSKVDGETEHLKVQVPIILASLGARTEKHLESIKKDSASKYIKSTSTSRVRAVESRLKSTSEVSKSWSSLKDENSYIPSTVVEPVMMTRAISVEDQLVSMDQAIEKLATIIEEKDV